MWPSIWEGELRRQKENEQFLKTSGVNYRDGAILTFGALISKPSSPTTKKLYGTV